METLSFIPDGAGASRRPIVPSLPQAQRGLALFHWRDREIGIRAAAYVGSAAWLNMPSTSVRQQRSSSMYPARNSVVRLIALRDLCVIGDGCNWSPKITNTERLICTETSRICAFVQTCLQQVAYCLNCVLRTCGATRARLRPSAGAQMRAFGALSRGMRATAWQAPPPISRRPPSHRYEPACGLRQSHSVTMPAFLANRQLVGPVEPRHSRMPMSEVPDKPRSQSPAQWLAQASARNQQRVPCSRS